MLRSRRWALPAALVALLGIAGCGGGGSKGPPLPAGCRDVSKPAAKHEQLKAPKPRPVAASTAVVETSCGTFQISLAKKQAPKTVGSFAYLVDRGLYNGLGFHRVVPGFVVQGGDPLGTGLGGPGYHVDEPPPQDLSYTRGTVAMAKTAVEPPGRSGSQFFVVTAADAGLPPAYALLGKVTKGMDVVDRISALGNSAASAAEETTLTTGAGAPSHPVVIERVTLR